jgi:galactose oxidase
MHYSLILPNKQILIIGGGNYDYVSPVFEPLLLTPVYNETTKDYDFKREIMAPSRIGALYHSVALLMRDGRIFTSGGNGCRAIVNTK